MRITWNSVKSFRPSVSAFLSLLLCGLALGSPATPVSAQTKVVLSQVSQLGAFPNGGVQSSGNYAGSAMVINQQGNLIAAEPNGSDVVSFNLATGTATTIVSGFSGVGSVAIDAKNNLYISNLYAAYSAAGNGPYQNIVKIPYVSGAYVAGAAPTGSTPACTGSDTVECYLPNLTDAADGYYIQVRTMTFDSAGDLFVGTGEGQILECTAACLTTGTPSTVVLYQEPTGTTTNGATYVTGAMAIDANGNLFFTDSNFYANSASMYVEYSYASNLKELAYSSSKGFATTATTLYTLTPTGQGTGPESNEVTGLAIANGTVYFTTLNDGVFAFTDTSGVASPTTPYAISTQGGRALAINGTSQLYVDNHNATAGVDYLMQISLGAIALAPASVGGTASTVTNVTAILNDGTCTSPETIAFATTGTNKSDFVTTYGTTCTATLTGTQSFPVTVTFTPTGTGIETATVTATDSNSSANSTTATLTGLVAGTTAAAAPTFSPVAGTYTAVQSVVVSSATASATIYYTTDGKTTPTTSSNSIQNGQVVPVNTSETIMALAVAPGYNNSTVSSAAYVINIPAATPTFSPVAGTYTSAQTVKITSTTANATIYYTTNGTTPTTSSSSVASGGTITVAASETVNAIAVATGSGNSAVGSATYVLNLPAVKPTVVLSQVTQLGTFANGGVQSSGNYAGSAMVINQLGNLIAAEPNGNDVVSFNLTTGAATTLISNFSGIGTVAIDSKNNLYLSTLYDAGQNIVKIPFVNGAYVAATSPSSSTPVCTGSDTAECYLPNLTDSADSYYIQIRSMTFDSAGDLFIGTGEGQIIECTAACLTTGSPATAVLYTEPAGTSKANSDAFVTGAMAVDVNGNLFFTDSDFYANNATMYTEYSYSSNLKELTYSSSKGFSTTATTLYTYTPPSASVGTGPESDEITGLTIANNTVYFTTINDGVFAFIDTAGAITPTTPYTVSTQGGRAIATTGTGLFYVDNRNTTAGVDYLMLINNSGITLPAGTVGGTPTTATNVTAILNDGTCTTPGTIAYTTTGTNKSDFAATTGTPCTASLASAETFPVTVTFTPTGSGTETATLTATDSASNSGSTSLVGTVNTPLVTAAAPTFSPVAGTYTSAQSVTLTSTTAGATIYYTTDGTTPTTSSSSVASGGQITVSVSETVKAIAVASGDSNSTVASAAYVINIPAAVAPTFSPVAGTYTSVQTVALSSTTPGATIYYTTNGSVPNTSSSSVVSGGTISVGTTETVMAFTVATGYTNSTVSSAAYTINLAAAATPTFSPVAGTYTSTQTVAISSTTPSATIYYTTNGTTPTTSSSSVVSGGTISVSASETVTAIATATGYSTSAAGSAAYVINLPAAATPTFSPAAGTYTAVQTVKITSTTPSATIYYTTNGTTPTTSSSSVASGGTVSVGASETLTAIAAATGYSNSAAGSAAYVINIPTVATPTFSPAAGTYTSVQTVTITSATPSATIYYTTNGTVPNTSSTSIASGGTISVGVSETVQAFATATGDSNSAVGSAAYVINLPAATPTFSPVAGTYTSVQTVTITSTTPSATIYYTTNGTTPTTSSSSISSGATISVGASETVQAIATATGSSSSAVASAAYVINLPAATPTFSPAAGTYTSAQTVTISSTTPSATIYYTTNGSTPTTSSSSIASGGTISVGSSETVTAIAGATGYSSSAAGSAAYVINLPAAAPTFSPAAGTYTSAQTVTVSSTTPSATIYYTTNGTAPTTSSTSIASGGTISVGVSETLMAIATATGSSSSPVSSSAYVINIPVAAAPTFSPAAGTYTTVQTVTISSTTAGSTIYYTTNGSTPTTASSSIASGGTISVGASETVMAIAVATGYTASPVASAAYVLNLVPPNFTVAINPNMLTVAYGSTGQVAVSVTGTNQFSSAVSFACSGLPTGTTCAFLPATVTPSGSTAAMTTLTVTPPLKSAALERGPNPFLPGGVVAAGLFCLIGLRKRKRMRLVLMLMLGVAGAGLITGCGGSTTPVTTISTVTVTATSGSLSNTSTFVLTVN